MNSLFASLCAGHGPATALALFAVGLVVAFINSVAGGGSTLSLPLMILLGLPPTLANGTNRVGILVGNLASVSNLRKHGYLDSRIYRQLLPATAVGALLGTLAAVQISDRAFTVILVGVILFVSVLSRLGTDPLGPPPPSAPDRPAWAAHLAFFALGLYGSLVQVGIGFLQIFALRRYSGLDLVRVNALKNALTTSFLLISSLGFAISGKVIWGLALSMAMGASLGGVLGSKVQRRQGHAFVQRFIRWAGLALAAKLLWDLLV